MLSIVLWTAMDTLNFYRVMFHEPPISLTVNGLVPLTLLGIAQHTGWKVRDVG